MRRSIEDRNGRRIIIRDATESDAARMIRLMQTLLDETPYMLRLPEEQRDSPSEEARYLRLLRSSGNSLVLLAEDDRYPVGTLIVTGGGLMRIQHVGYLGMGVLQHYWGAGIGAGLLKAAIDWAHDHPIIRKLSLQVFTHNERAVALYRQYGFEEEGLLRSEVRLDEGYIDMLQMALPTA